MVLAGCWEHLCISLASCCPGRELAAPRGAGREITEEGSPSGGYFLPGIGAKTDAAVVYRQQTLQENIQMQQRRCLHLNTGKKDESSLASAGRGVRAVCLSCGVGTEEMERNEKMSRSPFTSLFKLRRIVALASFTEPWSRGVFLSLSADSAQPIHVFEGTGSSQLDSSGRGYGKSCETCWVFSSAFRGRNI